MAVLERECLDPPQFTGSADRDVWLDCRDRMLFFSTTRTEMFAGTLSEPDAGGVIEAWSYPTGERLRFWSAKPARAWLKRAAAERWPHNVAIPYAAIR